MATTNVTEHHDSVQYAPNSTDPKNATSVDNEKVIEQHEHIPGSGEKSLVYADDDQEPELHVRTWIAVAAMIVLNFVILVALQGPPTGVSTGLSKAPPHHGILTECTSWLILQQT